MIPVNPERPDEFILLQEIPGRVITDILTTSEYDDDIGLYAVSIFSDISD